MVEREGGQHCSAACALLLLSVRRTVLESGADASVDVEGRSDTIT